HDFFHSSSFRSRGPLLCSRSGASLRRSSDGRRYPALGSRRFPSCCHRRSRGSPACRFPDPGALGSWGHCISSSPLVLLRPFPRRRPL
ncbi:hypothetical protein B0H14DRAFT_3868729, partial [Mycena olivaceomarginata]